MEGTVAWQSSGQGRAQEGADSGPRGPPHLCFGASGCLDEMPFALSPHSPGSLHGTALGSGVLAEREL